MPYRSCLRHSLPVRDMKNVITHKKLDLYDQQASGETNWASSLIYSLLSFFMPQLVLEVQCEEIQVLPWELKLPF
jgi:hypothetical protein